MVEFAKTLGLGFLAVILSPFILLLLVIYIIYTILVYVFYELCSIVFFFFGKDFKNDDAETFALLEAKEEYAKKQEQKTQPVFTYVVQQPPGVQIVNQEQQTKEGDDDE